MVVGPKFNPSTVKDAEAVVSPTLPSNISANDISLSINIDAGGTLTNIDSVTHEIQLGAE